MYKVETNYCVTDELGIVKVYFMNGTPFTYDEIDDILKNDEKIMDEAFSNPSLSIELISQKSEYLIQENIHPLLCEVKLHPESILPDILK